MDWMNITSCILLLSVGLTIFNQKYLKAPTTIAVMSATLILSLILILIEHFFHLNQSQYLIELFSKIDFSQILLRGMLGYLLFAGALHINPTDFKSSFTEILTLSTLSTLLSTLLIAWMTFILTTYLNTIFSIPLHLSWIACLLFGALISPTDPIAVLGVLKTLNAPKSISTKMAGESLFNDGVGIVLFLSIYQLAYTPAAQLNFSDISYLFLKQSGGGILFGWLLGLITQHFIQTTQGPKLHILITLALVTAGYTFADQIGVSGPLAMVILGMMLNQKTAIYQLPPQSKQLLHQFWELIDELLNIVLFSLIAIELILLKISISSCLLMILIIPIVLCARWITVLIPIRSLNLFKRQHPYTVEILVWGGLRGGLAVAMALSLPDTADRNLILLLTYAVVTFSIVVQGSTIPKLVKKRFLT